MTDDAPGVEERASRNQRVVIVAAVAENGVIGRDGELPWRLPEDLRHFRATTTGHPVVMGRRTYDSIGRALPGRVNIVVTRQRGWQADGVLVAHSVADALTQAEAVDGDVMLIGGAQIYAEAMGLADVQILTEVHQSPSGDAYYPHFDPDQWHETRRENHEGYAFVQYHRRGGRTT